MTISSKYETLLQEVHYSVILRSLTFKLESGETKEFGQTTTQEKQVKIGSSLGFTAYIGTTGISLDIKTSLVEEDGKEKFNVGRR